ncbi:MAG: hypothetical protein IH947_15440, partial [Bacteroidetes bacterium]|nr:hypothetical protein [Bacteroidota bacterium]
TNRLQVLEHFIIPNLKINEYSIILKLATLSFLMFIGFSVMAQSKRLRYRDKGLQIGLVPGISTNGIHSGWYFNKFSLNIFAGISAGSQYLEIGGISNLSLRYSSGIQIAGLANVVGSNTFVNLTPREERDLIVEEEFQSFFSGIQLAGGINFVRNDLTGSQITAGFNIAQGSVVGFQAAGLGNVAYYDMSGVQIAGLYNVANSSVSGFQLSLVCNFTKGPLFGTQVALINRNVKMVGKNSSSQVKAFSLQLGMVNVSKDMTGTQIGLLNYAKEMGGTQIGLVNIFSTKPVRNAEHNGVPIGILNFGSKGHFMRFSANELFLYNIERSTGNCSNCSRTRYGYPINDKFQKFNQNAIILSYNPSSMRDNMPHWAFGLKYERLMYIKYTMAPKKNGPQNKTYFLSWGAALKHINWTKTIEHDLSLHSSINGNYGRRFKLLGQHYWYVGLSLNSYFTTNQNQNIGNQLFFLKNSDSDVWYTFWPGYSVGIQI